MEDVTTFQRARSEEQRETRRRDILGAATAMLAEMPVSALTLNELSRRVGLAKSNVMRYFESREAVLLELLTTKARAWLAVVGPRLAEAADPSATPPRRAEALAAQLAASLAADQMLCELISVRAGVLEHNISTDVAARYRKSTREGLAGLAAVIERVLPELSPGQSAQAASVVIMLAGVVWTYTHPAPPLQAVYDADPTLAIIPRDFTAALSQVVTVFLTGLLAQASTGSLAQPDGRHSTQRCQ